jgi:hypothetical protein
MVEHFHEIAIFPPNSHILVPHAITLGMWNIIFQRFATQGVDTLVKSIYILLQIPSKKSSLMQRMMYFFKRKALLKWFYGQLPFHLNKVRLFCVI